MRGSHEDCLMPHRRSWEKVLTSREGGGALNEKDTSMEPAQSDIDLMVALMNSLGWAVVVLDLSNRIRVANSAAASLLGFRKKEARAQDFGDVIKCKRLARWLDRSIEKGSDASSWLQLGEGAGGRRRTVEVRWLSLRDEKSGGLVGYAMLLGAANGDDLTEPTRAEELWSHLRHEVLTPLTSLRGFAELLLTRHFSEERMREFIQIIHDETLRVTALLDRLLGGGGQDSKPADRA